MTAGPAAEGQLLYLDHFGRIMTGFLASSL